MVLTLLGGVAALLLQVAPARGDEPAAAATSAKPALTVTVVRATKERWPRVLPANGNIAAWQEAVIGAEAQGLRLVEVRAQVGDRVAKGALLARLQDDTAQADLAVSRAALAEAEASRAEAQANAERARQLQPSGALSAQQIQQYTTAETTAQARVASAQARVEADRVRLAQTRIVAPDAGVISSRSATLGAVVSPGTELFRLIRQARLEWRAEVPAGDLAALVPGTVAAVVLPGGATLQGRVRTVAPTVDVNTRNALVYVDLGRIPRRGRAPSPGGSSASARPLRSRCHRRPWCCATASTMCCRCRPIAGCASSRWRSADARAIASRFSRRCRTGPSSSRRAPASWPTATS